jgi:hypothetical protein
MPNTRPQSEKRWKRRRLIALTLLLGLLTGCATVTVPCECPAPALRPWTPEQELRLADEIDSLDLDANYPMIARALTHWWELCAKIRACQKVKP